MEHFRHRKYRGPEVWRRVREAYLAGESGPSVAKRYDVGLANLRKKARREGWTRTAAAPGRDAVVLGRWPDEEETPRGGAAEAPVDALTRAAALLDQGRAAEALALIRAAEALSRAAGAGAGAGEAHDLAEALAEARAEVETLRAAMLDIERRMVGQLFGETEARAAQLAEAMLKDRATPFALHAACCYHWRARVLGPEVAALDFAHAVNTGGMTAEIWNRDGTLRPLPRPEAPIDYMAASFEGQCDRMEARERGE